MKNKKTSPYPNRFRWFYIIGFSLILTLPLLSVPPWFFPPDWGKTITFRIISSVMLFVFVSQAVLNLNLKKNDNSFLTNARNLLQSIKNKKSSQGRAFLGLWLLLALFGIFFLATIFSLDFHFSLWGSPYRGGGFVNYAFYIFFAILAFLTIRKSDWKKLWDIAFITGILVSLIAIFQKFAVFSSFLLPYTWRPVSTMGGPIFLAIYLLLLSFLALSFGIKTKGIKKLFYFSSLALFVFVIFLTATRAAIFGLFIGFSFFIFFWPDKKTIKLKILFGMILVLGLLTALWLNTQPQIVKYLTENKIFGPGFQRIWSSVQPLLDIQHISLNKIASDARCSGWRVAWQALKQRPILGYGPENFSIAFDKYYDPSLPGISQQPGQSAYTGWWDRAHNIIFETSINAGIPALIIYLLLFGVLFWQLQFLKKKNRQQCLIYHSIQTTFLAYLTANFFSYDTFSTYLISFLLIGYALYLINYDVNETLPQCSLNPNKHSWTNYSKTNILIIFVLFIALIWFIWTYNLKPLEINKEINWAVFYSENNKCDKALKKMETILASYSIIDNYVRLKYIDVIKNCTRKQQPKEEQLELSRKAIQVLKQASQLRPFYTRTWWLLGNYTNILIEQDKSLKPEIIEQLKEESHSYFKKAHQLSPRRQEIFVGLIKTSWFLKKYQEANKMANECVKIDPRFRQCWWLKALSNIYIGNLEQAKQDLKIAQEKGYNLESEKYLLQLLKPYIKLAKDSKKVEHYQILAEIYEKLIKINPKNFQYHASLAYVYKTLGKYEKAREQALIVLELSPESRVNVEKFLKDLSAN